MKRFTAIASHWIEDLEDALIYCYLQGRLNCQLMNGSVMELLVVNNAWHSKQKTSGWTRPSCQSCLSYPYQMKPTMYISWVWIGLVCNHDSFTPNAINMEEYWFTIVGPHWYIDVAQLVSNLSPPFYFDQYLGCLVRLVKPPSWFERYHYFSKSRYLLVAPIVSQHLSDTNEINYLQLNPTTCDKLIHSNKSDKHYQLWDHSALSSLLFNKGYSM